MRAIYHKENPNFRIAYVANGRWQFQQKVRQSDDNRSDPWEGMGRPATLEVARDQLETRSKR